MPHIGSSADGTTTNPGAGRRAIANVPRFAAHQCLLGPIRECLDSGGKSCLKVPGKGHLWLDGEAGLYRSEMDSPAEFYCAGPAELVRAGDTAPPARLVARPADEVLYLAAWHARKDALLDECQPFDVVQLRCWPNFTRLPHTRYLLPLSSLLSRRPSSLSFAFRMLRVPEADALRFYSAAMAAGYLRVISSQPVTSSGVDESPSGDRSGSFWSRLFDRISGL
ncbi:hypothetical protein [Wenzhouxiangella sediminis]|uniref:Uncharacterized protein n=1 Tax=Wenzhouxiangella sediminis TaxID=1792836 RepID=A0A3E1K8S5_9GAMM|nr:hypothetical protein [Wenzhouxiangella sediminis]RFF30457.1 hypothetical protein DZC52_08205 [Wenzhouxiangella sediminis]